MYLDFSHKEIDETGLAVGHGQVRLLALDSARILLNRDGLILLQPPDARAYTVPTSRGCVREHLCRRSYLLL